MDSFAHRQHRHRGRKDRAGEVAQPHRDRRTKGAGRGDGSKHTTAGTLVTLGVCVARDLRDRDGVARPLLRRGAVRMITSRRDVVRRLGASYLRSDPPAADELPAGSSPPSQPRQLPAAPCAPESEATANALDANETRPKDGESHPNDDDTV